MSFHELRLAEPIVRAVAAEGYTTPTPIQKKAIPEVAAGRDVLGCAQTGTGKTGAFAMPILHRLAAAGGNGTGNSNGTGKSGSNRNSEPPRTRNGRPRTRRSTQAHGSRPRALVLCPTRELATQIYESFKTYGRYLPLRHTVVFGGVSQARQVRDIRNGIDVLVATPGRLLDLMDQGVVDLGGIEVLVLDEADRMLDMGFIRDIRKVVERIPARRQTLLFSATMPDEIRHLADSLLYEPVFVKVDPVASTVDAISQSVYHVVRKNKATLLERLIRQHGMGRTLVFTRTKYGADKLVKALRRSSISAEAIHGNKAQNARTRALDGFKSGAVPVLVATDIASRGIDVDEITHVVNYDLPNIPETYVHRIGRTARAGASGNAVSFCDHEEFEHLRGIEQLIRKQIEVVDGEDDLTHAVPTAPQKRERRSAKSGAEKPAGGGSRGGGRSGRGRSRGGRGRVGGGCGGGRSGGTSVVGGRPTARRSRSR